jgi:hypothetical protein
MLDNLRDQDKQYRRGMLLGLTMAEVMTLIIFVLLLTLAATLLQDQLKIADEKKQNALLQQTLEVLIPKGISVDGKQIEDALKEYVRTKEENSRLRKDLIEARAENSQIESLREIKKTLQSLGLKADAKSEDIKDLKSLLEIGAAIKSAIASLPKDSAIKTVNDLLKLIEKLDQLANAEKLAKENAGLKGQVTFLQNKLGNGKGAVLPPCWADISGHIQYIFDISLQDDGRFVVHNNAVAERADDQAKLPVRDISYDAPMLPTDFRNNFRPIFDYSQKQDPQCRFFVRIFDRTQVSNKTTYKASLKTVEGYFYKLELGDASITP